MLTVLLPPVTDPLRLSRELQLVRNGDREDAAQEAWVAHLEGRGAATAVNTYAQRLRRLRLKLRTGLLCHPDA